jgi:hypothetical protein
LRNQLLRKELLAVLCSMFWFSFLSFSFPSLFVCNSFGHPHNCFLWIWLAKGSRVPIYSKGAQHQRSLTSLVAWQPDQNTVGTWIASLCLLAVAATSPCKDRLCTGSVRPWVARRQQALSPGVPVWRFPLLYLFPKRRASVSSTEGRRSRIFSSSINPTF